MGDVANHHSLEGRPCSLLFALSNPSHIVELVDKGISSFPRYMLCSHVEVLRAFPIEIVDEQLRIDLMRLLVSSQLRYFTHMVMQGLLHRAFNIFVGLSKCYLAV